MAIPDYQSIMLPLLKFLSDGLEHSKRDCVQALATQFNLSDDELRELLPSGQQEVFDNRVGWARTYLKKAGLIESPRRSIFKITQRGLDVLKTNPAALTVNDLKKFPEFIEFLNASTDDKSEEQVLKQHSEKETTPEESLEYAYQTIRQDISQELLTRIKSCSPNFFERLVVELLVKMGYGGSIKDAGKAIGKSGDEGIDGVIKEDHLGLDVIYIQAKRWEVPIGRPEIQKFVGALMGQKAKKGVFISTSKFTKEAKEFVANIDSKIVLIDGEQLTQLMIDNDVGVSKVGAYEIKKIDSDYFDE
jgi:restriction system protein